MTFEELRGAVLAGALSALPDATRGRVPARFHRALKRAMSRNPQQRFPDVRSLLRELDAALVVPLVRPSLLVAFGVVLAVGGTVFGAALLSARNPTDRARAAGGKPQDAPRLRATEHQRPRCQPCRHPRSAPSLLPCFCRHPKVCPSSPAHALLRPR